MHDFTQDDLVAAHKLALYEIHSARRLPHDIRCQAGIKGNSTAFSKIIDIVVSRYHREHGGQFTFTPVQKLLAAAKLADYYRTSF